MSELLGTLDPNALQQTDDLIRTPKGTPQAARGWYEITLDGKREAGILFEMPRSEAVGYDSIGRSSMGLVAHFYYQQKNGRGSGLGCYDYQGHTLVLVDRKWCTLFNLHEQLFVRRVR